MNIIINKEKAEKNKASVYMMGFMLGMLIGVVIAYLTEFIRAGNDPAASYSRGILSLMFFVIALLVGVIWSASVWDHPHKLKKLVGGHAMDDSPDDDSSTTPADSPATPAE